MVRFPVRALWVWPLATAGIGAVEMGVSVSRFGGDAQSFLLGLAAAGLAGLPIASLAILFMALRKRRGRRWGRDWGKDREISSRMTALGLVLCALLLTSLWIVPPILDWFFIHPLKLRMAEVALVQGLLFLLGVPFLWALVWGVGQIESIVDSRRWPAWLGRVAWSAIVVFGSVQLFRTTAVMLFGRYIWVPCFVAWAACVASWLPSCVEDSPFWRKCYGAALAFILVCGGWGLHHVGARALLMHDARVFPRIFEATMIMFDRDRDGDFPLWLGGADCDPGDASISSIHAEVVGNGIDDNCFGGDRQPHRPEVPPTKVHAEDPLLPIFLITIDAVSASHLQMHGYSRDTMPNLAKLAARSRWFQHAHAPSTQTFRSTLSLLSGQSTERMIEYDDKGEVRLRYTYWLPVELRKLGYHTSAYTPPVKFLRLPSAEHLLFDEVNQISRDVADLFLDLTSRLVVDQVIADLEIEREKPSFMWLHLMDPHAPHLAPRFFSGLDPVDDYDSELAWVDEQLGRLFAAIEAKYGSEVILIVTADHGEQLGERGFFSHSWSQYQVELQVPLVIYSSRVEPGEIAEAVSTLSVTPTILDLVGGAQGAAQRVHKLSATSVARGTPSLPVFAYAPDLSNYGERRREVVLIAGGWKLFWHRARGTRVLFNLSD